MNFEAKKEIIQKIVSYKKENNLEELQIARLLRKELSCFAIRWTTSPAKEFVIYNEESDKIKDDSKHCFYTLFRILDFLYLIQELEHDGFVNTLPLASNKEDTNILFDKEKYKYNVDHPIELPDNFNIGKDFFYRIHEKIKSLVPMKSKQVINIDIVDLFDKYATKIIYPLPKLEEYLKNNFQS